MIEMEMINWIFSFGSFGCCVTFYKMLRVIILFTFVDEDDRKIQFEISEFC